MRKHKNAEEHLWRVWAVAHNADGEMTIPETGQTFNITQQLRIIDESMLLAISILRGKMKIESIDDAEKSIHTILDLAIQDAIKEQGDD